MADLNKVSDEMADLIKIIHESLDDEEKEIYQEYNLAKEKTQALYGMVDEFTNELIEALGIFVWPKTDYDTTVTTPGDVIV